MTGEPEPPGAGSAATVSMNAQRFSRAATPATSSRSATSIIGMPSEFDREHVDRAREALDVRRLHVLHGIAADERHVALLEPRHRRSVEAGRLTRRRPRPLLGSPREAAGAQEERVAAANPDARELLPRLEVRGVDRRTGFQVGHAAHERDVRPGCRASPGRS